LSPVAQCPACGLTYLGRACPACLGGPAAEPDPVAAGSTFHGLEVLEVLGRGGMGVVYKARQTSLDRVVALKVLAHPDTPGFEERFTREARALAALSHPNIVTVHDFGRENGVYFLVAEYIEGPTLRQKLLQGRLDPAETRAILGQLCDALEFAHRNGVIHRDLKPENVLLDAQGRAKIVDFGLAKFDRDTTAVTQSGAALGTAHYVAPEQLTRPDTVDARADLYSLAVVAFEMMTGELPLGTFEAPHPALGKALSKDPARRHAGVAEFRRDFFGAPSSRVPMWAAGAAILAIAAVAAIALAVPWKRPPPGTAPAVPAPEPPRYAEFVETKNLVQTQPPFLVAFGPDFLVVTQGAWVVLCTLEGAEVRRWKQPEDIYAIAVHPDGATIVTSGIQALYVWNAADGSEKHLLHGHRDVVPALAFSPDGKILASAGVDRQLFLWNASAWTRIRDYPRTSGALSMAFRPDGKEIAVGDYERKIRIWRVEGDDPPVQIVGHQGYVFALAYSPDGRRLVSGSIEGELKVWDLASDAHLTDLSGPKGQIRSIATSNGVFATAGTDRVIRIWSWETLKEVRPLRGPTGPVTSVAFRRDGRVFASASSDGSVRLWGERK
jgi:predicted Ser/Thr protein kinase